MLASMQTTHIAKADSNTYYAKVKNSGVMFCALPSENSALFEIPSTYFVKFDYVTNDYYHVFYGNIDGYVRKDKVTLMNGTPRNPYFAPTYTLFTEYSMYEQPIKSSTEVAKLSESASLTYYGKKSGQVLSKNNSTWYYSSVEVDGTQKFGYVFSRAADDDPEEAKLDNFESFEIVDDSIFSSASASFTSLSTGTKIMLIVAISVPSLLILYFLVKPSKIMQVTKAKKKTKTEGTKRRVRHGDYFEFDESEL